MRAILPLATEFMSLIGPRPLLPRDQPPDAAPRLAVRPGMTGWAQVCGGSLLSPGEKGALDEWYIRNASLALDLKIAARTILVLLGGERRMAEPSDGYGMNVDAPAGPRPNRGAAHGS